LTTRKLLRDRIKLVCKTQDQCAYDLKIDAGILSKIINCTKDPTDDQVVKLSNYLNVTTKEVVLKNG